MTSWPADLRAFAGARVLVTGAAGFLGRRLTTALCTHGAQVEAWDLSDRLDRIDADRVRAVDLTDADATRTAYGRAAPTHVVHLAGRVSAATAPDLLLPMLRTNLMGTAHLLDAARRTGHARVVALGSAEEASDGDAPSSPYAATKAGARLVAAWLAASGALPVTWVRPSAIYGPDQADEKLVPSLIRDVLSGGTPWIASPDRRIDLLYLDDAVTAVALALLRRETVGRTIDIGTGVATRIGALPELIAELAGVAGPAPNPAEDIAEPSALRERDDGEPRPAPRPGERDLIIDPDAARVLLDWRAAVPLREGLLRTIDAMRPPEGPTP